MRWNPYILYKNHEVSKFYSSYFAPNSKLLFVLGNGFDVRMNNSILQLRNSLPNFEFDVLLIDIEEDPNSSSHAYQALADQNYKDFNKLTESLNVRRTSIRIWEEEGISKRRVGDKNAADLFSNLSDLQDYSDVIIDISALPRVIYFSLIGKALSLIDNEPNCQINLMVTVSENAKIDSVTNHINPEEDLEYSFGLKGYTDLEGQTEKPLVWFPVLGERMEAQISKSFIKIKERNSLYEICPVLPFPSKDPRRSDAIVFQYHQLLFDSLQVESQNFLYSSEQNPFATYSKLSKGIENYKRSLSILDGCQFVLSSFASKLFSIGVILTAYEHNEYVGVLNVSSMGYQFEELENLRKLNETSEVFLTWLTGLPYKQE